MSDIIPLSNTKINILKILILGRILLLTILFLLFSVKIFAQPPVAVANSNSPVCAGSSIILSGNPSGPYTYSWTGPNGFSSELQDVTIPYATEQNAGTYTLTVTDPLLGESLPTTTEVAVNAVPAPTISTSGPITFCAGGSVTLTSSAGTDYFWSTGVTGPTITVTTSGSYTVRVTDSNGCQSASSAATVVAVNALPTPTLTSSAPGNVSCAGTNVIFTAGGGSIYNFRVGGISLQNGSSATYSTTDLTNGSSVDVIVTGSGCQATSSPIINIVNPLPIIFISSAATCSIDLATYSLAVTVSPGTTVTSSSGTTTNSGMNVWTIAGVLKGTNITVRVAGSGGCETSLDVLGPDCACPVVPPPVSEGNKSYCSSGIIPTINATVLTGETVDWYNVSTGGTILVSGLSYTPTGPGTFYAQSRNTTTNCVSSTRTAINVTMNVLTPTLISSDANNTFCAGTSITFTAGGGNSFNFRIAGASVQSGALATYTTSALTNGQVVDVIVTNSLGCTATSAAITNTVNALPIPTLTSSDSDNNFCVGTSIIFTAGGGTGYNFRIAGVSVQNSASATYTTNTLTNGQVVDVIVTNANGCVATSAGITNSVFAIPTANAGSGGNNCGLAFPLKGTLIVGTGTWSKVSGPGDVTFSPNANTGNSTVSVTLYGSYTLKWTVTNGPCSNNNNVTIVFIQQPPANGGIGGDKCGKDFVLNALRPASGTGTWTKTSGPGAAVFTSDTHQPNARVAVDQFGTYNFTWTVVNSTCISSEIVKVVFHDVPSINAGRDTTICLESSIQLQALGTGSFSWVPAALLTNPNIANPITTPVATTTFTVNLTDQFGCKNSDNIVISVREKLISNAGPDQMLGFQFETSMNAGLLNTIETGVWSVISGTGDFSDITNAKTPVNHLSSGINKFLWTVTNGLCSPARDSVLITVNDFVIPTLITPNMDGRNDYLVLRGLVGLGKTELVIFDRRGAQVYKNLSYDNTWNGVDYNKNPLPDDTYFYVLKSANGKSISGYIVIRR